MKDVIILAAALAASGCAATTERAGQTAEAVPAAPVAAAQPAIPASIDGSWRPSELVVAGVTMPDAMRAAMTLVVDGENYRVISGDEVDRGTLTFDDSTLPPRMIVTSENGRSLKAIYAIDGDLLTVAYDLEGADYPVEFTSPIGSNQMLAKYRRGE